MKVSTDLIWIWIHNREVFRECVRSWLCLVLKALFVDLPQVSWKSICFCQHKPVFKSWSSFTRFHPKNIQSQPFIFVACSGATLSLDVRNILTKEQGITPRKFSVWTRIIKYFVRHCCWRCCYYYYYCIVLIHYPYYYKIMNMGVKDLI